MTVNTHPAPREDHDMNDDRARWQEMAQEHLDGLNSDDAQHLGGTLDALTSMPQRTRASLVTVMAEINRERTSVSVPTDLPYVVTIVTAATDTEPESRQVIAAFAEPDVADWFTDALKLPPGAHSETPGLAPPELAGLPPGVLPTTDTADGCTCR